MDMPLVAPSYPPGEAYHAPTPLPFAFGVDTLTIDELLSAPATKAIMLEHAPWLQALLGNPAFLPFTSVFTVRDATPFLPGDFSKPLAAMDRALKALPRAERPTDVR